MTRGHAPQCAGRGTGSALGAPPHWKAAAEKGQGRGSRGAGSQVQGCGGPRRLAAPRGGWGRRGNLGAEASPLRGVVFVSHTGASLQRLRMHKGQSACQVVPLFGKEDPRAESKPPEHAPRCDPTSAPPLQKPRGVTAPRVLGNGRAGLGSPSQVPSPLSGQGGRCPARGGGPCEASGVESGPTPTSTRRPLPGVVWEAQRPN